MSERVPGGQTAAMPADEVLRLQRLRELKLLDSAPDPVLDALTRSAARALGCPIALVSLVDADRQWFKARVGLQTPQTPRRAALCSHTILGDGVWVVPDARADGRFADNPLVTGEPHLRAYAGVPLRLNGVALGTLCVIDHLARDFSPQQQELLADLGRCAEHWLEGHAERLAREQALETEVERRTAALREAQQQADTALAARSHLLATMSHEVRTPLNGVVGIVDLLRHSPLTPYQVELADTLQRSAEALLALVDTTLDLSRLEAGRLTLAEAPCPLRALVEDACEALQPLAQGQGVVLRAFVDPLLPDALQADAVRLRQVITNLVGNAIKFSGSLDAGGRITVRAERDGVAHWSLAVQDNGIGLDADARARIFEPFVQADATTGRRFGGSGLGLAICRGLVQAMGGTIGVDSEPGLGARFLVQLPLRPAPAAEPAFVPDLNGLHCHLALDDAELAADWGRYLRSAGAGVATGLPAAGAPGTVLLVDAVAYPQVLAERRGHLRHAAVVAVHRGPRRAPRLQAVGHVALDRDPARLLELVTAVSLAAARQRPAAPAEGGPALASDTAAPSRVVLVAEDDEVNRSVIARQLALLGLATELAADGQEALTRWRAGRGRIGLLLTDMHMPHLDGQGLARAIRAEEPVGERLPIVALTGDGAAGDAARWRAAGLDGYLSKPVDTRQLRREIGRWIDGLKAA